MTGADAGEVLVGLEGGVLRLTLNRPDRRNALDDEMVVALISQFERAATDEEVRAVLVTGVGEHFCGGFDILTRNAAAGNRPRAGSIQRRLPLQAHRLIGLMSTVQVPVVCAVRGWAAGIGLHLALAADFTVVSDEARLWEPFSERGFTPDSGGTWLLVRRVGETRAREMLMLGREVSGSEAAAWGMVHGAVAEAELDDAAGALASSLADGPTVTLGLTKWLLHTAGTVDLETALTNEALALEISSRSSDFREGLAAFGEKRPPRFTGR